MNMNELLESIIAKVQKAHYNNYLTIEVEYKSESHIGGFGIYVTGINGDKELADPSICSLDYDETVILLKQIEAQKEIEKCNTVNLLINGINDYQINFGWDEQLYEENNQYSLAIEALEKSKIKSTKSKDNSTINNNRFQLIKEVNCQRLILSYDLSQPKIISQFFSHLFSLFQVKPEINYEGFMYNIMDTSNNEQFCAGLSSTGIGYYATEQNDLIMNSLNDFHNLIFSSNNKLVECSIFYEHDFGKTEIGYRNNQLFEVQMDEK